MSNLSHPVGLFPTFKPSCPVRSNPAPNQQAQTQVYAHVPQLPHSPISDSFHLTFAGNVRAFNDLFEEVLSDNNDQTSFQNIQKLISRGPDVNTSGWTTPTSALGQAIQHNKPKVAGLLLDLGAKDQSSTGFPTGKSLAYVAYCQGYSDLAKQMKEKWGMTENEWDYKNPPKPPLNK